MSHPEDPVPQAETESSEQPRSLYEPLTTTEEATAKLEGMLAKPAEEISDKDIFQAIADTFVARCNQYKEAGVRYEEDDSEVNWKLADEVILLGSDGERAYIGFWQGLDDEGAFFNEEGTGKSIEFKTHNDGSVEVSHESYDETPSTDGSTRGASNDEKTNMLNYMLNGLKQPLTLDYL